ncbi:MAG: hypothetical protein F6K42_16005, partial [Leptolyngbya sp. SIO1D8]|nr:hypothetical protein [Leptolyngbya sp. SIO1D8]
PHDYLFQENQTNIAFLRPWLGEGLPKSVLTMGRFLSDPTATETDMLSMPFTQSSQQAGLGKQFGLGNLKADDYPLESDQQNPSLRSREMLSLLLSQHLIERHGGTLTLQGHSDSSYRFLVTIPAA